MGYRSTKVCVVGASAAERRGRAAKRRRRRRTAEEALVMDVHVEQDIKEEMTPCSISGML